MCFFFVLKKLNSISEQEGAAIIFKPSLTTRGIDRLGRQQALVYKLDTCFSTVGLN